MSTTISGLLTHSPLPEHTRLVLHPSDNSVVDVPNSGILSRQEAGDKDIPGAIKFELSDDANLIFSKVLSSSIQAKLLSGKISNLNPKNRATASTTLGQNAGETGIQCTFGCCSSTAVTNFGCGDTRGCCECTIGTAQTVTCYTC